MTGRCWPILAVTVALSAALRTALNRRKECCGGDWHFLSHAPAIISLRTMVSSGGKNIAASGGKDAAISGHPVLRFEVLGPLRVWRGDQAVPLGPVQRRVVLAVLLLQRNRPIGRQQLIDAVWGKAQPSHAVNLVQRHVSGLRMMLEPQRSARSSSDLLSWTGTGYLFKAPAGSLDLDRVRGPAGSSAGRPGRRRSGQGGAGTARRAAAVAWAGLRRPVRPVAGRPARAADRTPHRRAGGAHRSRPEPRQPPGGDRRAAAPDRRAPAAGAAARTADVSALPLRPAGRRVGRLPGRPQAPAGGAGRGAGGGPAATAAPDPVRRSGTGAGSAEARCAGGSGRSADAGELGAGPAAARAGRLRRQAGRDRAAQRAAAQPGQRADHHRGDHRDRRHGRRRQDRAGGALGTPVPPALSGRAALREPARLRSGRHRHAAERGDHPPAGGAGRAAGGDTGRPGGPGRALPQPHRQPPGADRAGQRPRRRAGTAAAARHRGQHGGGHQPERPDQPGGSGRRLHPDRRPALAGRGPRAAQPPARRAPGGAGAGGDRADHRQLRPAAAGAVHRGRPGDAHAALSAGRARRAAAPGTRRAGRPGRRRPRGQRPGRLLLVLPPARSAGRAAVPGARPARRPGHLGCHHGEHVRHAGRRTGGRAGRTAAGQPGQRTDPQPVRAARPAAGLRR